MNSQALEALRAELQAARPPLAGIIEGLKHDLEQQDLEPRDRAEVEALLADYQRRESLMQAVDAHASGTFDAIGALLADGYPALPEREIDPVTFDALEQNRRTIELAQRQFRRQAITVSGESVVGPEQPIR